MPRVNMARRRSPRPPWAAGPCGIAPTSIALDRPSRMIDYQATIPIQHGGNQSGIRARLRLGDRPMLDFSAPLNGLGPPLGSLAAARAAFETIDRYPEPGCPRLVECLADRHGVPADRIL